MDGVVSPPEARRRGWRSLRLAQAAGLIFIPGLALAAPGIAVRRKYYTPTRRKLSRRPWHKTNGVNPSAPAGPEGSRPAHIPTAGFVLKYGV
jgi:hypothetical protein